MKYRKKPVIIEATQWFRNEDHPKDNSNPIAYTKMLVTEGKIVRYYNNPENDSQNRCAYCRSVFHDHGWIDT